MIVSHPMTSWIMQSNIRAMQVEHCLEFFEYAAIEGGGNCHSARKHRATVGNVNLGKLPSMSGLWDDCAHTVVRSILQSERLSITLFKATVQVRIQLRKRECAVMHTKILPESAGDRRLIQHPS